MQKNIPTIYFDSNLNTSCLSPKPFYEAKTVKESPSTILNYETDLYQVSKLAIQRKNRAIDAIKTKCNLNQ